MKQSVSIIAGLINILLTMEAKITKKNWPDTKVNHCLTSQVVRVLTPGLSDSEATPQPYCGFPPFPCLSLG